MLLSTRSPTLLAEYRIAVSQDGAMVRLEIGKVTVHLPYDVALQLSQWLRVHGRQAKRFAGDDARIISVVGTLTQ